VPSPEEIVGLAVAPKFAFMGTQLRLECGAAIGHSARTSEAFNPIVCDSRQSHQV